MRRRCDSAAAAGVVVVAVDPAVRLCGENGLFSEPREDLSELGWWWDEGRVGVKAAMGLSAGDEGVRFMRWVNGLPY